MSDREQLTQAQAAVLEAIRGHIAQHGWPPSITDICTVFGFKSKAAAVQHLKALERKGFIRRQARTARGITILRDAQPQTARN